MNLISYTTAAKTFAFRLWTSKSLKSITHPLFPIICLSLCIFLNNKLFCHIKKRVINILPSSRACSYYWVFVCLLKLFDIWFCDLYFCFICNVTFVCKYHYVDIFAKLCINLIQPRTNTVKRFSICYVKNNYYPICPLIICICYSAISFLACCIPNLQFNCSFVDLKRAKSLQMSRLREPTKSTPIVHK